MVDGKCDIVVLKLLFLLPGNCCAGVQCRPSEVNLLVAVLKRECLVAVNLPSNSLYVPEEWTRRGQGSPSQLDVVAIGFAGRAPAGVQNAGANPSSHPVKLRDQCSWEFSPFLDRQAVKEWL